MKPPDRLAAFFILSYFAQGMGGLAFEPLSYLLKDRYGLGPGAAASFVAWMTFPFLLKPLFGLATDLFPIGGLRRKPHAALGAALWAGGWLSLWAFEPGGLSALLTLLVVANCGTVLSDVVCDGLMVEKGKALGRTALFQSMQMTALYAALLASGLGGGWLAARGESRTAFALAAVFPLLALGAALLIQEQARPEAPAAWRELSAFLRSGKFWRLAAVIFLWSFSPSLGTAQFYFQAEVLRLDPVTIGALGTLGGGAGLLGAGLFGRATLKGPFPLRTAVGAWGLLSLASVLHSGPASAAILTVVLGCAGTFFRLALMDAAARSSPLSGEATSFAALMSVFNVSAWASNTAGGWAFERLRSSVSGRTAWLVLVAAGAACTLAAWAPLRGLRDDAAGA